MKKFNQQKAFTLIELLVVMAIIAVLAVVIMVNYNHAKARSRDAKRLADISSIKNALGMYYDHNGKYVISTDAVCWIHIGHEDKCGTGTEDFVPSLASYIAPMPTDPIDTGEPGIVEDGKPKYGYGYYSMTNDVYFLRTHLEVENTDYQNLGECYMTSNDISIWSQEHPEWFVPQCNYSWP